MSQPFEELKLPQHTLGITPEFWYVGVDGTTKYLLNNGSGVVDINGVKKDLFYFNSEMEAHNAMSDYYNNFGRVYPYSKEWAIAISNYVVVKSDTKLDMNESQVMNFI